MLSSISSFRSTLPVFAFSLGNAAFSRKTPNAPPNRSGQSTKTCLNLMTAVFGSVVSMDSIWSYPTVDVVPVVCRMASRVNARSAEVIGVPSAHTALSAK